MHRDSPLGTGGVIVVVGGVVVVVGGVVVVVVPNMTPWHRHAHSK